MLTPLRAAAEFADRHDQRVLQQAALVHVGDQGRQAGVEHRARLGLHPLGQVRVVVPGVVVGIGDLGPDYLDDSRAGLDQAAGQQAALAEGVAAVQRRGWRPIRRRD